MTQVLNVTLTMVVQSAMTLTTPVIPSAVVGQAYSFQMGVSGGTAPYNWTALGLPPGLSISTSGLISGTPTTAGSYNAAITVSDSGT